MADYEATISKDEKWEFKGDKVQWPKFVPNPSDPYKTPIFEPGDTLVTWVEKSKNHPIEKQYTIKVTCKEGSSADSPFSPSGSGGEFPYTPPDKLQVIKCNDKPGICSTWNITLTPDGDKPIDPEFQVGTGIRE